MQPVNWKLKRDREKHPVRLLAGLWEQGMHEKFGVRIQFTPKEYGQIKKRNESLGNLTQDVVRWIVDPINWWHFCQQVRQDSGSQRAPDCPQVGYLLAHCEIALKVMRWRLKLQFPESQVLKVLERRQYEQIRTFLLVSCTMGLSEKVEQVKHAQTLTDMQQVFIEMVGKP